MCFSHSLKFISYFILLQIWNCDLYKHIFAYRLVNYLNISKMEATLNYAKEKLSFLSHAMNNCHPTMKRYYSKQYKAWKRQTTKIIKQSNH